MIIISPVVFHDSDHVRHGEAFNGCRVALGSVSALPFFCVLFRFGSLSICFLIVAKDTQGGESCLKMESKKLILPNL
nr:MAG TPA: hypothetical protein [Caudoviricetes sp.]